MNQRRHFCCCTLSPTRRSRCESVPRASRTSFHEARPREPKSPRPFFFTLGSEATEAVFCVWGKKAPSYQGAIIKSSCLSVCLSVCVCLTFVVFTDSESCTRPLSTNPGSVEAGEYGHNAWDVFRGAPSRPGRGRRAAVDFTVCFGWGGIFCSFLFGFFFELTRPAAKYDTALPPLPLDSYKYILEVYI